MTNMYHLVAFVNAFLQDFHRCIQVDVQVRSKHLTNGVVSILCVILLNCKQNRHMFSSKVNVTMYNAY